MGINIRTKGASAERDLATVFNVIINEELVDAGYDYPDKPIVQRNQNQTAVGGADLTGTFGLAIECKRQEQLSINTWWKQCTDQALRNQEFPVLMYKQNRKPWKVVLPCYIGVGVPNGHPNVVGHAAMQMRCEITYEDFLAWFRSHVACCIANDWIPRT